MADIHLIDLESVFSNYMKSCKDALEAKERALDELNACDIDSPDFDQAVFDGLFAEADRTERFYNTFCSSFFQFVSKNCDHIRFE